MQDKLNNKQEYINIDIFKYLFALLILSLHLSPFVQVNATLNYMFNQIFTRIGVPFFFIASGFFLETKINNYNNITKYIKRLMILYIFYTLIYLPQIFYELYVTNMGITSKILYFLDHMANYGILSV